MRATLVLALCLLTVGCAPTAEVSRGGGARVDAVRALDVDARPRIAIAAVLDHTGADDSLAAAVAATNRRMPDDARATPEQLLEVIRQMITTDLFASDRFIVLERDGLDAVLSEQVFALATDTADAVVTSPATLEGADLLVVGAITAIDPGLGGGAVPIPVPIGKDDGFGILQLRAARGYIAMDLRVLDVRTGRVLNATAVEGRHWRFGLDFTGYFDVGHDVLKLPGLVHLFRNTPLEQALQQMSTAAVDKIAAAAR
jgi:curli biogenesis system outer membrane secretion channel CsgG